MEQTFVDARVALRNFKKNPGYISVIVLTLALGVGANSAIFSVVDGVLLRPLPYAEPDGLTILWTRWADWEETWLSGPELFDLREQATTLEQIAAWMNGNATLTGDGDPERIPAAAVTANTFSVLGARALSGRGFTEQEEIEGAQVVVLGHALWQRRFGGDRELVGKEILVNSRPRTVVGIMPASFRLPHDISTSTISELWLPLGLTSQEPGSRGDHNYLAAARLAPGATVERANQELAMISRRLTRAGLYPPEARFGAFVVPVKEEVLGSVQTSLLLLLAAGLFLLLIACANIANLLLARSDTRQREFAIRTALGAGQGHLLRQLGTEMALLVVLGSGAGLLLAWLGIKLLLLLDPWSVPRLAQVTIDGRVALFTLAVTSVTSFLFGWLPAAAGTRRQRLAVALKDGRRGYSQGLERWRSRQLLVVMALALAVVLVMGAGLMIRTFWNLQEVDPGFQMGKSLTFQMALPAATYSDSAQVTSMFDQVLERVRALPAVESAGAVRILPLTDTLGDWFITIEGRPEAPGENPTGDWQVVSPGYFETLGIPLVRGRFFTAQDRADSLPVIAINQAMAERYWPSHDPIGKRFRFGGDGAPMRTIIGVVGNVRHNGLAEDVRAEWYCPLSQYPASNQGSPLREMVVIARTSGDPVALVGPVREAVRSLDPNLPITKVRTLDQVLRTAVGRQRFVLMLLGSLATVALMLAAVGVYGLMSYAVSRQVHDIGIRMALGARRREVLKLVVGQGMKMALAGIALGVLAALMMTRAMTTLLYGVAPTDPATFLTLAAFLALVAVLANYLPALRASRVDPMVTLRSE